MEHREDMAITNEHAPTSSQTKQTQVNEQGKLCTHYATLGNEHSALLRGLAWLLSPFFSKEKALRPLKQKTTNG